MIRSCFGGASRSFVISGSEGETPSVLKAEQDLHSVVNATDSMIYVWHKDNIEPLETLAGHGRGSVNDVAWNPTDTGMFASASGKYCELHTLDSATEGTACRRQDGTNMASPFSATYAMTAMHSDLQASATRLAARDY